MGFRAPLTLVADPITEREHRVAAAAIADSVYPHLISLARECDKGGQAVDAHKARSAALLIDEIRGHLSESEGAA